MSVTIQSLGPAGDASAVTVDGTQTLTNKTMTSPVLNTPTVGTSLLPTTDDGAPLGSTTKEWSDLFLASGGVINWAAGDVTITHSANLLAFAGAASGYTFDNDISVSGANKVVSISATSSGQAAYLAYRTGGLNRWLMYKDAVAEAGGDAGSNFNLQAYDDSGVLIDAPISIARVAGGAITIRRPIASSSSLKSTSATLGVGYATGAGGTVTQATSKSTGVTLNTVCGAITMNAANLANNTIVSFTLTNSAIAATDVLILNHISGGTALGYVLNAQCGAGTASINVKNISGGALAEALVIQFALIKGVTA